MSLQIDRAKVEVPYQTRWWGSDCTCDPRFVEAVLGDGMVLLGLQPLNTRPNYYLIRVDSKWHVHGCRVCRHDEKCPDELTEHLDEIYEAIEDEYGDVRRIEEGNNEDRLSGVAEADLQSTYWPVFDDDCGTCWWIERNPAAYAPDGESSVQREARIDKEVDVAVGKIRAKARSIMAKAGL